MKKYEVYYRNALGSIVIGWVSADTSPHAKEAAYCKYGDVVDVIEVAK